MFRPTVLVVACALFSLPSVAQSFSNPPAELSPNKRDFPAEGRQRFDRKAAAPISIVRLRIPRKAKDLFNKAMDAWHNHAAAEAQQDLDRALQLDPDFPDALTLYAGIHANHQDWGSAEEKLQAAIRSDPTFSPAYVVLAAVYNTQARFADAQRATEQAVSAGAKTWEVEYETARALIGQKQFEDALTVSEAALRSSPHKSMLHLAKAHALLGLRRYPEAAAELKTFLQIQPSGDGCEEARSLLEQVEKIATQ